MINKIIESSPEVRRAPQARKIGFFELDVKIVIIIFTCHASHASLHHRCEKFEIYTHLTTKTPAFTPCLLIYF